MNADLILMSRMLDGAVFAAYGKASMLARTVLFLPMPIVLAMFPRAVVSSELKTLLMPAGIALALATGLATGVSILPGLALKIMYGVEGEVIERLLRAYAWAAVPLAMTMVLAQYVWARHAARSLLWLAPVAAGYGAALWVGGHGDAFGMIGMLAAGNAAALALLVGITLRLVRRERGP
jgi:O-antigen/teichoic acid export membrane protein